MTTRADTARLAADALERAPSMPAALIGFDGFIDTIIDVVDQRRDMSPSGYSRIPTIAAFAERCRAAAGKSANLELVVRERRFGGNGPLMAGALGAAGCRTTYIGAVGRPDDPTRLHPIYGPLASRCDAVHPIAPPALTDALEFDDGKLMLGQPASVQAITWDRLRTHPGEAALRDMLARSAIVGIVNWTMMGGVEGIWRGLIDAVLPTLRPTCPDGVLRRVFIDLADPAKRSDADVAGALRTLREMDALTPVTLGLNLAEAERLASVLGVASTSSEPRERAHALARAVRSATGLSCVVVHPRQGAAAARRVDAGEDSAWFDGPMVARPALSTGAGDHFNAGFALGLALGVPLPAALAIGCATSGAYVRDAQSPDRPRLVKFLRDLPEPEQA